MAIKDSGDRTAFSTGAVRDMQDNKGRCDLLPLEEITEFLEDDNGVLFHLKRYEETEDTEYLYFALGAFANAAYSGDRVDMVLDVSVHFAEGAEKYGVNNWQKGLPEWSYLSSGIRHYLKWKRGDNDERHDRAFVWNILCLLWTIENVNEEVTAND